MSRSVLAYFVAVSLLAGPSLCLAGFVVHECDCVRCDGCEHDSDHHHDDGCRHESDCPEDPCAVVAIPATGRCKTVGASGQVCALCITIDPVATDRLRLAALAGLGESPDAVNLPRPFSDIPLLI
ncbi:MAG: hypothetical protein ACYTFA_00615 [Planctomycetota bacterium]